MSAESPRSKGRNTDMEAAQKWGFWVRTKQAPYRAVRLEPQRYEDGRESRRGRCWVEVLEYGVRRAPERFFGADVETAGPHEWLAYYPAINEPVCGWGRPRLPDGEMQYCPRIRAKEQAFCSRHMQELGEEAHGRQDPHAE